MGTAVLAWLASGVMAVAQSGPPATPTIPVSVAKAFKQDVSVFDRGIGTAQPLQSVLVRARVDGTINHIAFTEGQEVNQGDLLLIIDPRPYQAAYDQAAAKKAADVAQLGNSKRDLGRYSELARSEFASRQSVDTQAASVNQGTASVQADDAAITLAKLNLDFARVTAPISGRVGLRLVDEGNLVHASDTAGLVTINQVHPIAVVFTLPQDQLAAVQDAVHAGKPLLAQAYSSDGKTKLSQGTLLTLDNAIDTTTGTIKLKATFANTDDRLWPGQFVNVRLQLRTLAGAVVVPDAAVMHGANGLYVYMVKPDNTVAVQPIEIGQDDGALTVVTAGLSGSETVVVRGQSRLTDGIRVSSTPPDAPAPRSTDG